MLEAIVNNRDAFAWQFEKSKNVARGVSTDGDDAMLPRREAARHDTAINHAAPVVLVGHLKGRKVMDRSDTRARCRPNHAAIARDVKDVELMTRSQARELQLVPQNIFYR